jgi:short-subunit dehydrogenase
MTLAGKRVLITGASSGIGAVTARLAAERGAQPILVARRPDALAEVAAAIARAGGTAHSYPADLAEPDAVAALAARVQAEVGVPDVLVNNAGAGRWKPLAETGAAELQQMMAVPALAALNLTRGLLEGMRARGCGRIVNVNSAAAHLAWPNAAGYIAARHALDGASAALRSELHGSGITVAQVALGTVDSPYWDRNPGSRQHLPKPIPGLMPVLSVEAAARQVLRAADGTRDRVVAPGVFRALFLARALAPDAVAAALRR